MAELWKLTDDTENLICRRVSPDGLVEMGVFPVLFGFRVRAGWTADRLMCQWDWCAGDGDDQLRALYGQCLNLLTHYYVPGEQPSVFDRFPETSEVKPWYRDLEFSRRLRECLVTPVTYIYLPRTGEIRRRLEQMNVTP